MTISQKCKVGSTHKKSINVMHHINSIKRSRKDMIFPRDAKNALDKIQYPFMIQPLRKLEIKGNLRNLIKDIYGKPTANIIFYEILKLPH